MQHAHHARAFEDSGKRFVAVLNGQPNRLHGVAVRLPDGSVRAVPGEHFDSEEQAMAMATSSAHELVGFC